jgi:UDP-N-acetylmuramate--alanine ligase
MRRLDVKLHTDDYMVVDDYAHHPTEIKATLTALKNMPFKRTVAVFQPHRYTRTQLLLSEFGKCFDSADKVFITDIYAASEPPISGVDANAIVEEIKKNFPGKEVEFASKDNLIDKVSSCLRAKDIVVMLGAGDIVKLTDGVVKKITE